MNKFINCWDDLVFESRRKDYGAFLLRYNYPYYLAASALVVIFSFLAAMVGPGLFGEKELQTQEIRKVRVIDYNELAAPPPIERIFIPPKQIVQPVKVEKYVAPIVTQEEVDESEDMMTMEEVAEIEEFSEGPIGDFEGIETVVVVEIPDPPVEKEVEQDRTVKAPEFPGGKDELSKWLKEHLKYPSVAQRMGIEGNVIVEFFVDENGKICDPTVKESLHRLCDNEAMRLVRAMPDWIPGEKNGIKNRQKYTLPVTFVL
jgi:periplasmic protein TonB